MENTSIMKNEEKKKKLRPIVFVNGKVGRFRNDDFKQRLLLDAMRITHDPKQLKELIGVRTVAEVYMTLDKMAMRKEYHKALVNQNLTFDAIAGVIGSEMHNGVKSSDRLNAAKTLLKSLGMDKYDTGEISGGGNWEDLLLKAAEDKNLAVGSENISLNAGNSEIEIGDYEVDVPVMPDTVKSIKEDEKEYGKSLYE